MVVNLLPGVPSQGTLSLTFLPYSTPSFTPSAPSAATLKGGTAVIVQCLVPAGTYTPPKKTREATEVRRACSIKPIYVPGPYEVEIGELEVVMDPQDLAGNLSKAYTSLAPDTEWWMVERLGKDGQTDIATGDKLSLYYVKVLSRNKNFNDEAGAEASATIQLAYQGTDYIDVTAAA